MQRSIENDLLSWKNQAALKPLVLRGARQVGKTYVVEKFAKDNFGNFININCELSPHYKSCFESLDTNKIIPLIEAVSKQTICAGETLLFIDEIQECPNALMSLRYFKEQIPNLHVIAAGSLLELCINQPKFRMPVGRVQFLYMHPLSFKEYLMSTNNETLLNYLGDVTIAEGINPGIHHTALEEFRTYMTIGGMPEAVAHFTDHHDYNQVEIIHRSILEAYRGDFGKYDPKINIACLQAIYRRAPAMVAQHFKFSQIDPDMQARDLRPALHALQDAGIIHAIHSTNAAGIPLSASKKNKKFKLLFVDVGLVKQACDISSIAMLKEDIMLLNQGALTEQYVGQELLAYSSTHQKNELYYWERNQPSSTAEIDYLIQNNTEIMPIEVKSGHTGRLKSLQIYLQEKKLRYGLRVSAHELQFNNNVLSIPLYMIHEIPRLLAKL